MFLSIPPTPPKCYGYLFIMLSIPLYKYFQYIEEISYRHYSSHITFYEYLIEDYL